MGYKKVTLFIKESEKFKEKFNSLEDFISLSNMIEEYDDECFTIKTNSKGVRVLKLFLSWTKWYDELEIVEFYYKVFDELAEEDYLYAAAGKEVEDYQVFGRYGYAFPCLEFNYYVDF